MNRPQVILFDAVGTLFGVKGSVGQIYSELAQQFGVNTDEHLLNIAFYQSFQDAPPMAFPGVSTSDIPRREYAWWEAIAIRTFNQVGALEQFTNFPVFFAALYTHFTTAEPWFVYPDVIPLLEHWHKKGARLGVVSNFDSRIYTVLPSLGLSDYFDSITISTEVGVAKPDAQIFDVALKKHNCVATDAWHIGDSYREDYEGAKAAGLRAFWLKRPPM